MEQGPTLQGADMEYMSPELFEVLKKADLVLTKGQSNFTAFLGRQGEGLRMDRLHLVMAKGEVLQGVLGMSQSGSEKPLAVVRIGPGYAVGTGPRKRAVFDPRVGATVKSPEKTFDGPLFTATDLRAGKEASMQFLIGKCMAKLRGRGNPTAIKEVINKILKQ